MFRGVSAGKRAVTGLSLFVLLLLGGAAPGCASGEGQINLRDVTEFINSAREITETVGTIMAAYNN